MRIAKTYFLLIIGLFILSSSHAQSGDEPLTRLLFIYDASNSMNGSWNNGQKHNVAQRLLAQAVDSLKKTPNLQMALRVYGHQKYYRNGQDCNDTKLEVPFSANSGENIKKRLSEIRPKGTTPIAMTLEKAAGDFPPCASCRNIIILITDGIEECGGDPCTISMKLQRQGIILKPFVIGIGMDMGFTKSFECMGTFYNATDEASFQNVLGVVISQALNKTTAQVNLIDAGGHASETEVGVTLYDHFTGNILYNFVHTMNAKGVPDTLDIEPSFTYDLVAHTIPPARADSLIMLPGKHNILAVDAPQGFLEIKAKGFSNKTPIQAIVRKHGENKTLHVQNLNTKVKYLTGFYDIELLTTPRIYLNDIAISQSHTTTLDIPNPGLFSLTLNSRIYGAIYQDKDGEMVWVKNLDSDQTRQSFYLQPGDYVVLYRPSEARSTWFTKEKKFTIKIGSSTSLNL
ncbi:VWA domain-containing protein [bacterium SCSIO 12741]|nr:VWA domain-containing protein [bacterium SCSIO 12741]